MTVTVTDVCDCACNWRLCPSDELRQALVAVSSQRATLSDQVSELREELTSVQQQRDRLRSVPGSHWALLVKPRQI